jgi:hypothetical protein
MTRKLFVLACVLLACAGCGARHSHRTDTKAPGGPALLAASPAAAPAQASPPAVLQPDALDAPAAVAAAEAARATRVLGEMHHMDHGAYVHVDAGRGGAPVAPPAAQHGHHAKPASPSPRPSPSPAHHR